MREKNYHQLSDEALCKLCKQLDDEALEILMQRLELVISNCVGSFIDNRFEHEDLMQEGMVAAFRAILSFNPEKGATLKTFASVCIKNALKNFVKKKNNSLISADTLFVPLEEAKEGNTAAEDEYISSENYKNLKESLKQILSENEYNVFSLFIEGMSYLEIAEKLSQSQKSVDNAMQRVRKKLKSIL